MNRRKQFADFVMRQPAALILLVCAVPFLALAIAVIGYQDYQITSSPGNPASGYLRLTAQTGIMNCLTSSGANCFAGVGSPLTTKGDIYTFASANARLAVGTNTQCLTANSAATNGVDWEACSGGSGINYGDFGASFTGNGSALAPGAIAYGTLTVGCTIAAWNISASPADTATFDVWILGSPTTAIATVSNTVTASALPAISTGTYIHSTTLTSWTTTVAANSSYAVKLTAVGGTATYANLKVQCR